MNVHKNARLTPSGRALLAKRIEAGWTTRSAAEAAGVSVRTARKWLSRCPRRTDPRRVDEIEALRRQRMTGPQIARRLGMARSTVGLILRRLGLGRLALLEPKPPIVRYERDRPGEMIHLDIKKLGRINGVGHRFTGRGPGTHNLGRGWDFLHVCIDDASRLAYTELLPSERKEDTTAFLQRALDWLNRHGVAVERVRAKLAKLWRRSWMRTPSSLALGSTLSRQILDSEVAYPLSPLVAGKTNWLRPRVL